MFDWYYNKQEDYTSEDVELKPRDQLAQIEVFSKYYGGYNWSNYNDNVSSKDHSFLFKMYFGLSGLLCQIELLS